MNECMKVTVVDRRMLCEPTSHDGVLGKLKHKTKNKKTENRRRKN